MGKKFTDDESTFLQGSGYQKRFHKDDEMLKAGIFNRAEVKKWFIPLHRAKPDDELGRVWETPARRVIVSRKIPKESRC